MLELAPLQPVDYLAVGHVAVDQTPSGPRLGGTVVFAALMARALGLRAGIVTSCAADAPLEVLDGVPVFAAPAEHSTTFENIQTADGRSQILHHRAAPLSFENIPPAWRQTPIMHIAPIAQELPPDLPQELSAPLLGVTPQGWLRTWDDSGRVRPAEWEQAEAVLPRVGAAVLSREDVGQDEEQIERMAHAARVLVVTEGSAGSRLYWHGDQRRFRAPRVAEVDSTGAGDIFAAAFFARLYSTRDPWEAARFATLLASHSVTRPRLEGIPTPAEIQESLMEVLS